MSWPPRTSRCAAGAAARAGATVVVEALNSLDTPRAAIVSSRRALALIRAVRATGAANIAFLADLYHLSRMGEDLTATLARYAGDIAHVQVADVPGRGAPGTGQLDYEALFRQLAAPGLPGLDRLRVPAVGSGGQLHELRLEVSVPCRGIR